MIWRSLFEIDMKYVPIKPIGKGAYGVVCSAKDSETGEKVAIKKVSEIRWPTTPRWPPRISHVFQFFLTDCTRSETPDIQRLRQRDGRAKDAPRDQAPSPVAAREHRVAQGHHASPVQG